MLFRKIKQLLLTKISLNTNSNNYLKFSSQYIPRRYVWYNVLLYTVNKSENLIAMSKSLKIRRFLRDLNVTRLWSVWIRRHTLSSMVKRCRRDRGVREVFQCVKQTFSRSRRTLLLSATAAYKTNRDQEDEDVPCRKDITDEDLEALISDLDGVEELSRKTLYCINCGRRSVLDKKYSGVRYCTCKRPNVESCSHDGWVPYMEADEVIIWRKEYKTGQSYAYKVYGRYPELHARDFAAVQIDGSYRKAWDAAVAFLRVVQREANGVKDQTILHWEVMWPRMFSNRDYVFIRRHKQFKIPNKSLKHKEQLFSSSELDEQNQERPSVHSKAKRLAMERDAERDGHSKVFVIISRSCVHDEVPETKTAVRVQEYWSHMVVKSLSSGDKPGMEFVLTYYDDAGSGGLPGGVAAWATGRAAPAYLARMRRATHDYYSSGHTIHLDRDEALEKTEPTQDKSTQTESTAEMITQLLVTTIENITKKDSDCEQQDVKVLTTDASKEDVNEKQLNSENSEENSEKISECSKNDDNSGDGESSGEKICEEGNRVVGNVEASKTGGGSTRSEETPVLEKDEEKEEGNGSWWRYMYPFYYFL